MKSRDRRRSEPSRAARRARRTTEQTARMPRCRTREEFVDLLEIELAAEENAPWPGNWAAYYERILEWRDEDGPEMHEDCVTAEDYTATEDELKEAREELEEEKAEGEKRAAYIVTLEDRVADIDAPEPALILVAAREAVVTLRALLPKLDAAKFTPSDRKRLRMSLHFAAEALEAATRKAEDPDENGPPEGASEPDDDAEDPEAWTAAACNVDGIDAFEWRREVIYRGKAGTEGRGEVLHLRWVPAVCALVKVQLRRLENGDDSADVRAWDGGVETDLAVAQTTRGRLLAEVLLEQAIELEATLAPVEPESPPPPRGDPPPAEWIVLRNALAVTLTEVEAEYVKIGAEAFALYRAAIPSRKRAKMPGPPTSASEFSSQSRVWHGLVPAEAKDALNPALETMAARMRALDDRTVEARKALREAAKDVPMAVVGEGAKWRLIRDAWTTHDGAGRARSSGELTAHDILALGYEVRTIARLGAKSAIQSFEVWAWTCEDGAQIARYQVPKGEVPEPPIRWETLAADAEPRR